MYLNHIIEEISYLQSSSEIIDHARDDSGIYLVNIEKEVDVICIHFTNETNNMSKMRIPIFP